MVDVGGKNITPRRALASGRLRMGARAFRLLKEARLPKGDALALGQAAGILAAKRAAEALPLCHPLPLDTIEIRFELEENPPGVRAFCEAKASAKTGVEMEALSGVCGALLTVYDLVKGVDPALTLSDIRLEVKEGGKSGVWRHPGTETLPPDGGQSPAALPRGEGRGSVGGGRKQLRTTFPGLSARVVVVSDRCFRGEAEDLSGPLLREGLRAMGFKTPGPVIVPDETPKIAAAIRRLAREAPLVALTGGTGLSPRDVTPEAVESICDRLIPGIGERLRSDGAASTPMAPLSRSLAGQIGRSLVVALPGSPGAVKDGLAVLAEILPHALAISRGAGHEEREPRSPRRAS